MGRRRRELGNRGTPDFRNAGMASEAVGALLAANPWRARNCFALAFRDSPASEWTLIKAGFDHSGDAEAYSAAHCAEVVARTCPMKQVRRFAAIPDRGNLTLVAGRPVNCAGMSTRWSGRVGFLLLGASGERDHDHESAFAGPPVMMSSARWVALPH